MNSASETESREFDCTSAFAELLGELEDLVSSATSAEDEGAAALALKSINW